MQKDIPVLQPETLKKDVSGDIRDKLKSFRADVFVVAAYGLILPKGVLTMPRLGCINPHASLLPKYRGASPIHSAILNGDDVTGISIIQMDAGIDTGDIILQKKISIVPDERCPSLHDRMAALAGECILEALRLLETGRATFAPQDESLSSYAPMIQKSDGHIDWAQSTECIINLTRALDPWPGPYALYDETHIKIWRLEAVINMVYPESSKPGTVLLSDSSKGLLIKTGDGAVWVKELQSVGGKRMPAADYLRGKDVRVGAVLR